MVVKFNHQLFIDRIVNSDKIKFVILGFAFVFRCYFIFFRGISIDESSFWSYVRAADWGTVVWANYPPLFVFIFKCFFWLGVDSFQAARGIIFCVSVVNFYLLFSAIKNEKNSVPALFFWAICPASLVALGFTPSVFIEFFSIISWIAIKNNKKYITILSLLGLLLTSYTACIYILFLLILFHFEKMAPPKVKSFKILFLIFGIVAATATIFIRWNYLSWMKAGSISESLLASFEFIRNLVGYSWLALASYIGLLIYSKNRNLIFTFALMAFLLCAINLLAGLAAKEPRFVLFFVPWLVVAFCEISQKSRILSFIFLSSLFYHVSWFAVTKKSGLEEVIQQAQVDQVSNLHTDLGKGLLTFIPVEIKTIEENCCNTCAFLWTDFQQNAEKKITEQMSKQHLEIISQVKLGSQTLQPFFYLLAKGGKCL